MFHQFFINLMAGSSSLYVKGAIDRIDFRSIKHAKVDEQALSIELLADNYFLTFGQVVHADYDFVVVSIGKRDNIGQFVDRLWFEHRTNQLIFENLSLHYRSVNVLQLSIHFAYL